MLYPLNQEHTDACRNSGQGYAGLPLAIQFAKSGPFATGIDIDLKKIEATGQ